MEKSYSFGVSFFILLLSFIFPVLLSAQSPNISWQKCYGDSTGGGAASIINTSEGGNIFASYTGGNIWIVNINSIGKIEWQKSYGGSGDDVVNCIIQTSDGGYAFCGSTNSMDGDVTGLHGKINAWIVKIDTVGTLQWQKCVGGSDKDYALSLIQTFDGGFVIAGKTNSINGDIVGKHTITYNSDAWVFKLSDTGSLLWSMCYGGTADDEATSILQTSDSGYIFTGSTSSGNDDVKGNHGGGDLWVVKISPTDSLEWQKCYGGKYPDAGGSIARTSDGGFVVAGSTESNDGDVSGHHGSVPSSSPDDGWVIKIDSTGILQWQICLGGLNEDNLTSIIQTNDGGYATAGSTTSNDYPEGVFLYHGLDDYYVVKLNSSGDIQWQRLLGGTSWDFANSIIESGDGGLLVTGYTHSNDGDVIGNDSSNYKAWVVKLGGASGVTEEKNTTENNIYPNPSSDYIHVQLPQSQIVVQIKLYDVMGREFSPLTKFEGNIATADVRSLSSGVYITRVIFSNNSYTGTFTQPLIVQH